MSFRKRGEPLGSRSEPLRGRITPLPGARPVINRPGTLHPAPGQPPIKSALPQAPEFDLVAGNPGVRPSTVTSQPTVSTGCPDLDKILGHLGLPLGSSLLVEELGTTDFASVLLRAFAAQGVTHSRIEKNSCHVVVVGASPEWAKDLPGEYKGTTKEQKKAQIAADSTKVSVSNLATEARDMKIAWRYGLGGGAEKAEAENVYENYTTQFDITQRLVPGPNAQEMTFVPLGTQMVSQITSVVQHQLKNPKVVVRLVMPLFLNPSLYGPQYCTSAFVIPLVHSLRALLATHRNLVLVSSLPLDLYPQDGMLTHMLETLADGVVHLQPFHAEMAALVEKVHKNEPSKIQQGFVNIVKVPVLSERGMMLVRNGEYAFKNGRKKFEIEEWGIPVEEEDEPDQTTKIDF